MTSQDCGICGREGGFHVTITDEDGGVATYACAYCLGRLAAGDGCAVCGEGASGEYHAVFPPARWALPRYRVCSACRRRWVFDNTEPLLERLQKLDVARFGGEAE